MKAIKITSFAAIAGILLLSAVSCCQCPEIPKDKPQKQIVVIETQKSIDYDALCIVGNRYTIYGRKWDEDNPFEKQPMDDVVISAKKMDLSNIIHIKIVNVHVILREAAKNL